MLNATITAIEYSLPDAVLDNNTLGQDYPEWPAEKIESKIGIAERRIAGTNECASDLGVAAVEKLFKHGACQREEVDYLLLCTQSPDYFLPTTACIMQERLSLPRRVGALDFNLGCSGYIYGLGLAKGLIETGQAQTVLLVTAETYSKYIHLRDKSVRTLFGDAAAATVIRGHDSPEESIGPFLYGTDGSGANNLIVPRGAHRLPFSCPPSEAHKDKDGNVRSPENLYMNGAEIFSFTLRVVPEAVSALLEKARLTMDMIDLVVFHQANKLMLESLRSKIKIPKEKFFQSYRHVGNTVSCTIPIALKDALQTGHLQPGMNVLLVGFGVGYSWGATCIRWKK